MDLLRVDEEAEIGIIESVHMKNFMCYDDYKIEFSPKVNIILGRNGSGKSSILSAIQLSLGGKASSSGKAVVLKNTVQRGKPYAEISVTLRNRGSDAFQPEEYGSAITVVRKITAEGASSYKLKSSRGQVLSTKKEDLSAVLGAFNIQVNNPVAILTQEMSKTFLNTRDSKEKYNLFFQATQLEQLQKLYKACEDHAESVQAILENKEMNLCSLKDEIESLENEINNYNDVEENRQRLNILYDEFAWSVVIEQEKLIEKLKEMMLKKKAAAEDAKKKMKDIQECHAENGKQLSQSDQLMNKLSQEVDVLCLLNEKKGKQVKEVQKRMRQNCLDVAAKQKIIATRQKQVETLESQIAEMRLKAEENSLKEQLHIKEKIIACRKRIEENEKNRNTVLQRLNSVKDDIAQKTEEGSGKNEQYRCLILRCNEIERQIDKLTKQKANNLFAYGKYIPALLEKISRAEENGVFRRKPFGPLGLHVKVKERRWALAVERCLGSALLKSFLCDNLHDQQKLFEIMAEVYPPNQATPQIITSSFVNSALAFKRLEMSEIKDLNPEEEYDVRARKVSSKSFDCVLDMIQVDEPAIYNCLIDEKGIENVLLISTAAEARDIMRNNPPPKCNEVYTVKGNSVHPYPTYRFYSNRKKISTFIGVPPDLDENIRLKVAEHFTLKSSIRKLEEEMNDTCSYVHLLENVAKDLETQISHFDGLINKERVEIQVLEDVEVPDAASSVVVGVHQEMMKVAVWPRANRILKDAEHQQVVGVHQEMMKVAVWPRANRILKDAEHQQECEVIKLKNSLQNDLDERAKMEEELARDTEQIKNLNHQIKETGGQINKKKAQLDNLAKKRDSLYMYSERLVKKKSTFQNSYDEMLKRLCEVEDAYQQQLVILEEKIVGAEKVCPARVITTRKPQVIEASIDEMKAIIREADKSCPNILSTVASYNTRRTEYKKISGEIRCLKKMAERLQNMMRERLKAFEHIRLYIGFRVSFLFTASIYPLGYCGNLKFDHENHTLDIKVKVGKDIKAPVRSLSGGEKSYITVALLLALWDAVELPFRVMDEYDVYMDQFNRKKSMDLMINTAVSRGGNQFIFFSPQPLTEMPSSSDIKILMLPEPVRSAQLKRKRK